MMENGKKFNPNQWIEKYGDTLFRYAMIRLNDKELAEDVVQETFIAALHSSYLGDSSERTWLIGILKHKIMDLRCTPLSRQI